MDEQLRSWLESGELSEGMSVRTVRSNRRGEVYVVDMRDTDWLAYLKLSKEHLEVQVNGEWYNAAGEKVDG